MNQLLREIITYTLKAQVFAVSIFSFSPFYLLYVLFNVMGFFCKRSDSILSVACEYAVLIVAFSCLILLLLLNLPITKQGVEKIIEQPFLDRYMPGKAKALLPLVLFLFTFTVLGYLESASVLSRMVEFRESKQLVYQEIGKISTGKTVDEAIRSVYKALLLVKDLPYDSPPKTGIITDIASYFCRF